MINFIELKMEFIEGTYEVSQFQLKNMPYINYLQTEHWIHFKTEALKHSQFKCQLCSNKDTELNVHHKNYENRGRETFSDVIVLCKECHGKFHQLEPSDEV